MTGKQRTQQNQTDDREKTEDSTDEFRPTLDAAESTPAAEEQANAEAAEKNAEDLASELEEVNNRYLRLAADFENFKKRARQERLDLMQYGAVRLVEQLLPVVDDFGRVLEHVPEGVDENWLKGVQMTVGKLHEALTEAGVEQIEAIGSRFDPKLHEAIATQESREHPEDTVLEEVRRGYKMHDRVLRPAMVRVTRLPAEEPQDA